MDAGRNVWTADRRACPSRRPPRAPPQPGSRRPRRAPSRRATGERAGRRAHRCPASVGVGGCPYVDHRSLLALLPPALSRAIELVRSCRGPCRAGGQHRRSPAGLPVPPRASRAPPLSAAGTRSPASRKTRATLWARHSATLASHRDPNAWIKVRCWRACGTREATATCAQRHRPARSAGGRDRLTSPTRSPGAVARRRRQDDGCRPWSATSSRTSEASGASSARCCAHGDCEQRRTRDQGGTRPRQPAGSSAGAAEGQAPGRSACRRRRRAARATGDSCLASAGGRSKVCVCCADAPPWPPAGGPANTRRASGRSLVADQRSDGPDARQSRRRGSHVEQPERPCRQKPRR